MSTASACDADRQSYMREQVRCIERRRERLVDTVGYLVQLSCASVCRLDFHPYSSSSSIPMHGPLIDSHHRSSLSSNGPGALSSSEHTLADDEQSNKSLHISRTMLASSTCNLKKSSNGLDDVVEDEDEDDDDDDAKEPAASVHSSPDFFRWTPGHRRVMLTFCTICLFAFMTGVEYAVILPTAFDYVKSMTPADIYVGLILSSYSISGSIAGIILGKISDITGKVKLIILISNVFEIAGNILYFVTNNIHVVLLGRLIAGVGMGAVPPVSVSAVGHD